MGKVRTRNSPTAKAAHLEITRTRMALEKTSFMVAEELWKYGEFDSKTEKIPHNVQILIEIHN